MITFKSLDNMKFIFAHPVYLQGIWVKFVYEGHRVKVKVTRAKMVENPFFCDVKCKCKTSVSNSSSSIKHRAMKFACTIGVLGVV